MQFLSQNESKTMSFQTKNVNLFVSGNFAFRVIRSFKNVEESDEVYFSLVVYETYDDKIWDTLEVHPLKDREVIAESPDSLLRIMDIKADSIARYKAGPFNLKVKEVTNSDRQSEKVWIVELAEVEYEVDDEGRPTSPKLRDKQETKRAIREQEERDRASFRAQFRIDEDGHMYPRDLF